jgi:periplasmic protein TonB
MRAGAAISLAGLFLAACQSSDPPLAPPIAGPDPTYPADVHTQRHEGRVVVRAEVDPDGRVFSARVIESSGHPELDRAARDAVAGWQFLSVKNGGRAGIFNIPIEFKSKRLEADAPSP